MALGAGTAPSPPLRDAAAGAGGVSTNALFGPTEQTEPPARSAPVPDAVEPSGGGSTHAEGSGEWSVLFIARPIRKQCIADARAAGPRSPRADKTGAAYHQRLHLS